MIDINNLMGGQPSNNIPEVEITNEDGEVFVQYMDSPSKAMLDMTHTFTDGLHKICAEKNLLCKEQYFPSDPNTYYIVGLDNYEYNMFKLVNDGYSASWSRVK